MSTDLLYLTESDSALPPLLEQLQTFGYGLRTTNPAQCCSVIAEQRPDLIILEQPQTSRCAITWLVNIHHDVPKLPVLLLGSDAQIDMQADEISDLLVAGAASYFEPGYHKEAYRLDKSTKLLDQVIRNLLRLAGSPEDEAQPEIQTLKSDLADGLSVQTRLLPDSPAYLNGFKLSHQVFPSAIMSGDSVDYFELDDHRVLFYLADVSGHGAGAAMVGVAVTAMARQLRAAFSRTSDGGEPDQTLNPLTHQTPADLLDWFNRALLEWQFEQHVTMFLGILDAKNGILEYSNAAHFPGVIYRTHETSGFLEMGGLPLGICETKYEFQQLKFDKSLELVLFSDGVLEIMGQASILKKEASLLSLLQYKGTSVEQWVSELGLTGDPKLPDDIAILTVERQQ